MKIQYIIKLFNEINANPRYFYGYRSVVGGFNSLTYSEGMIPTFAYHCPKLYSCEDEAEKEIEILLIFHHRLSIEKIYS